ncbi:MAG TPA: hypothetical protein VHJ82_01785 [Actinomycetota bacterium]|nr:hypothetical protein [Actinomycetota bacterium]
MQGRTRGILLLLSLVSCSPEPEPAEVVSKSDFIRRADEICEQTRDDIHTIDTPRNLREGIAANHALVDEVRQQERMIGELRTPVEDRAVLERWLSLYDSWYAIQPKLLDAARANDAREYGKLARREARINGALDEAGQDYGFKECGYMSYLTPPPDDPEPTLTPIHGSIK